jgi:hypothetical protein
MKGARGINGVRTFVDVANHAVLIDHKGDAVGEEMSEIQDTVSLGHLLIGVTQQRETRGGFLGKFAVPLLAVETDPQNLRACRFKLGDITLIRPDLSRSPGCGSANIKGENHRLLAMEVCQLYHFPVLIRQSEVRRAVANLQSRRCAKQRHQDYAQEYRDRKFSGHDHQGSPPVTCQAPRLFHCPLRWFHPREQLYAQSLARKNGELRRPDAHAIEVHARGDWNFPRALPEWRRTRNLGVGAHGHAPLRRNRVTRGNVEKLNVSY